MLFTGNAAFLELPSNPEESHAGRVCSLRISNSREVLRQSKLKINVSRLFFLGDNFGMKGYEKKNLLYLHLPYH
jgi:hypothetical protein